MCEVFSRGLLVLLCLAVTMAVAEVVAARRYDRDSVCVARCGWLEISFPMSFSGCVSSMGWCLAAFTRAFSVSC